MNFLNDFKALILKLLKAPNQGQICFLKTSLSNSGNVSIPKRLAKK
jgi:hypothetical protein